MTPSSNPKADTPLQDAFKQSEVGAVILKNVALRVREPLAIRICMNGRKCKHARPESWQMGS